METQGTGSAIKVDSAEGLALAAAIEEKLDRLADVIRSLCEIAERVHARAAVVEEPGDSISGDMQPEGTAR